ncbi:MAG: pentapeptide repeat-containing protein, partial [Anaerolineae bacterium]
MTDTRYPPLNPYVGARAFQRGEHLHGRDQEVMDLLYLLVAERIVLLYSPSGAGKTSLIHAGLIPRLERRKFEVLPTMRVSLEPPPEIALPADANRYVLSLLLSLEAEVRGEQDGGREIDPEELVHLAGMTLTEYLDQHLQDSGAERAVLIFDQFEEILTADPTNLEAKHEFFRQVGDALRDQRCWALFAMREDYVAALDPYKRPVPSRLDITYRLERLSREAALTAIQEPARKCGVDFAGAAAERLVDNLRQVRVQQPDGRMAERPGPYVEPVQLQVVCRWLWEKKFSPSDTPGMLSPAALQIVEGEVKAMGDVNLALAGYYGDQVTSVAATSRVREGEIRHWFENRLITEQGIRGLVLHEPERSGDLDNRAIPPLIDAYLVREVRRRGVTWYELVHDRFIKPIQESNDQWRSARRARWLSISIPIAAILLLLAVSLLVGWLAAQTAARGAQTDSQTQVAATVIDMASTGTVEAAETAVASATREADTKIQDLTSTGNGVGQDYSGYDLSGLDLRNANLSRAILRGTELQGTTLVQSILTEADLRNARLPEADLSRADLRNARLEEADLRGARLVCANFRGASLEGTRLDDKWAAIADLLTSGNGAGQDLSGADLSQAGLDGAGLVKANLPKANLDEACLNSADLSAAVMVGAGLRRANLSFALLVDTDLSKSVLEGASLVNANLQGADLIDADLQGAFLEG